MLQKLGVFLIVIGMIVGVVYAVYCFFAFAFQDVPVALKITIIVVGLGLTLVLVSLIRERLRTMKDEGKKYRGVDN